MKYSYGKKGFGDQLKIEELIRIPGVELIANDRVCQMALSPVTGKGGFPRIPTPGFGACNNGIGREICPIGPVVVE
nr:hypothetical protein CFP56_43478 [Quercus suber]